MERVYTEVEGRKVFLGFVEDGVFRKDVTQRSIFRNSTAWGTEKSVIEKLKEKGVKIIRLSFLDTGEVLKIPLERFQKCAFSLRLPGKEENFSPAQAL